MKSIRVLFVGFLVWCSVAQAADREFTDVVHAISDQFHTRPLRIPMFGLVNAFVFAIRPAGATHIDLAVFEHFNSHDVARNDIPNAIQNAVGRSWKPFVQVRSFRSGREETVFVYMREQGNDWKLLVAAVEHDEAVVVQLKLKPDALQRWLMAPEDSARHWNDRRNDRNDRDDPDDN